MRNLKIWLAGLVWIVLIGAATAQSPQPGSGPTTVGVWQYQKELGLTTEQVNGLKQLFATLEQKTAAGRAKDRALSQQIDKMVRDNASIASIRAKLMEAATIAVDMRVADLETSRGMNKILKPEQLQKWLEIRNAALKKDRQ